MALDLFILCSGFKIHTLLETIIQILLSDSHHKQTLVNIYDPSTGSSVGDFQRCACAASHLPEVSAVISAGGVRSAGGTWGQRCFTTSNIPCDSWVSERILVGTAAVCVRALQRWGHSTRLTATSLSARFCSRLPSSRLLSYRHRSSFSRPRKQDFKSRQASITDLSKIHWTVNIIFVDERL